MAVRREIAMEPALSHCCCVEVKFLSKRERDAFQKVSEHMSAKIIAPWQSDDWDRPFEHQTCQLWLDNPEYKGFVSRVEF